MMRPNRDTIEGYFLAGKHMFWLPVRIIIRMIQMIRRMVTQTNDDKYYCHLRIYLLLYPGWGFAICK